VQALELGLAGRGWLRAVPVDSEGVPDEQVIRRLNPGDAPGSEQLRDLVSEVLEIVASLFGVDELGVRLTNATQPPCPRFHVDRVLARAVLTLAGPGSEYLRREDVNREKMGHGADGLPDESSGLILAGATPRSIEGDRLCVFKGEAWPGNEGLGLVHRSPPPDGRQRWLMTVDLLWENRDALFAPLLEAQHPRWPRVRSPTIRATLSGRPTTRPVAHALARRPAVSRLSCAARPGRSLLSGLW
jgi:hypothetical protein